MLFCVAGSRKKWLSAATEHGPSSRDNLPVPCESGVNVYQEILEEDVRMGCLDVSRLSDQLTVGYRGD